MSGIEQIRLLSWALYIVVFGLVLVRAIRRPWPAHLDMALFFGVTALLIILSALPAMLNVTRPWWLADLSGALLMSMAYLLLRLVRDFTDVRPVIMRASELGLVLSIVAIIALPTPMPVLSLLLLVAYFVAVIAYVTWAFARASVRARGVTRRRMQAVAAGTACIGLVLVVVGLGALLTALADLWLELSTVLGLASGICYFVGFAPPTWLRRAWQEPELRAFLTGAARLPRLPDTYSIVRELEQGAAAALGAPFASVGVWDPETRRLTFYARTPDGAVLPPAPGSAVASPSRLVDPATDSVAGRAFLEQHARMIVDLSRSEPEWTSRYPANRAQTALVGPITAGEQRLGVLLIFAPRAPIFADSDLELMQLLADQAAVILESRALIDQAARVRAREEATRLKDDFLSSAAHDLKTPLTGLVTQAQLMQRRAERDPSAPVDRVGLNRMVEQSLRLRDLVLELLDVSRLEHGNLIGQREPVDLAQLVADVVAREADAWQRVELSCAQPVGVYVDVLRIEQVLVNLVENALKYSPDGGPVLVRVWSADDQARVSVVDQGIGIGAEDLPLVFERFHRGRNVDDRRFAGMGLGLYIARGIVEQHGGRIWVESTPGSGSTFNVGLPLRVDAAGPSASPERTGAPRV